MLETTNLRWWERPTGHPESALKEGLVLGLGNPLLDISANVDQAFLKKYGLLANDQILAESKHQNLYKEMVEKYKVEYFAGGCVQNSLRVMQWLCDKPYVATYMGCVGDDESAKRMEAKANEDRVKVVYLIDKKEPTGACACLITNEGKNRSLCACLGASLKFNVSHLNDNYKYVESAQYFFTSGYHLGVSVDSIKKLTQHCEQNVDKVFLFTIAAPYVCTKYSKQLLQIYPHIEYLFANESEAREFSEAMEWPKSDLREIAGLMADKDSDKLKRGRKVIITQGAHHVLLAKTSESQVQEFPITQIPPNKVVDTNGAGDAFAGGFLAQLIRGQSVNVCIKCALYAASEVIQKSGCNFPKHNDFKV